MDIMPLEDEQKELLYQVVEASRNVPREKRQKFYTYEPAFSALSPIDHPGLPDGKTHAYMGDIEYLGSVGLLLISHESRGLVSFDVTPYGFQYYEHLKQAAGEPIQKLQNTMRDYISSATFSQRYVDAYKKWVDAEGKLWGAESKQQVTTIGHLCREAMQEFINTLVFQHQSENVDQNKAHIVSRLKAIISARATELGKVKTSLLNALITYWGAVNDLVQRQEHGAKKEGEPITWEDARRTVFQTLIVMYEIDKTLSSVIPSSEE